MGVSEIGDHLASGKTLLFGDRLATPFGWFEVGLSRFEAVEFCGGKQQHRIACHRKSRHELDGKFGAHLGLSDSDELLLVAVVDLNVPAPEVVLNHRFDGQIRIGANQKSRLTVEKATF